VCPWEAFTACWLCPDGTVVEYLAHNVKVKGSNAATGIRREKMAKRELMALLYNGKKVLKAADILYSSV
jgi:hypothetical protein